MKIFTTLMLLLCSTFSSAAEFAGIAGMVITNKTIENNNFQYPQNIYTMYLPNDPSTDGVALIYLVYKKIGTHQATIELTDKNGKHIDKCEFDASNVTKLPWIQTTTCTWSGRQSDGGITFTVYDKFGGKKEKIGELFLPAKNPQ